MGEWGKLAPRNSATLISSSTSLKTYAQHEHGIQSPDNRSVFEGVYKKKVHADVDVREVYFLIMHFLSESPCQRAYTHLRSELLEHRLLPRRYHAWYSRSGTCSGDGDDDGASLALSSSELADRFSFIEKDHLIKLLQQLVIRCSAAGSTGFNAKNPTAADASTLLGLGSVSLLKSVEQIEIKEAVPHWSSQVRWLHRQADQVHALAFREVGGGFTWHHRAPSIRAASYTIAKPPVLVDRIQIIKKFRGHRNAVYCAIFDRTGEYIITGSDDRLVKIWSTATGFCLCSCRGHDGDITDLAVSAGNTLMASASNDFFIRIWRFPDGIPISVLRGHTSAVTAIVFSPRPGCEHHLLSSSDDGTCRIWDARDSLVNARMYTPRQETTKIGTKAPTSVQPNVQGKDRILCCSFNASGTIFVTGSADKLARVWDACKWTDGHNGGPNYELDTLKGHEDDVNYVQFSGCAALVRPFAMEATKDESTLMFRNSWFAYESIVTCSRDGSAILWIPRPRKYHGKTGRWIKSYHLRVPSPPTPPQPPRGVGPRQRLLPTPRGVNMIVWSLDNSFVLAAIMDCRICVWNAVDGSLVHSLTGHSKSTFVLDVHPSDPRIAMSAGYDGRIIIWDIWEGHPIRVYETGEYNLVDGKFSPDGTSIVISDEVGQIYLLATGQGESQKDAKYDQFFLGDYRPLSRDVHGNVLDQETQLPPYHRNLWDLLCDANMIPYAEPYQSLYQQRRLGALGSSWRPPSVQLAVGTMYDGANFGSGDVNGTDGILAGPGDLGALSIAQQGRARWVEQPLETDDAMDGEEESVDDSGSDYTASIGDATDEDEPEVSETCSEDFVDSLEEELSSGDEHSRRAHLRRSGRRRQKLERTIITTSGRLVKRKFADDGYGTPLRRSGRHKKRKTSRQGPSSQGVSDSEFSKRPKRMAARNARLIFSQVSDTEDEDAFSEWDNQRSTTDEHISCTEEQENSTGNSEEMDLNEKLNIEDLVMDVEPSDVRECSHHKRSSLLVKLKIHTKRTVQKEDAHSLDNHIPLQSISKQESLRSEPIEDVNTMKQSSVKNQCSARSELDLSNSACVGRDQNNTFEDLSETGNLKGTVKAVENDVNSFQGTSDFSLEAKQKWELQDAKIEKCPQTENISLNQCNYCSISDPSAGRIGLGEGQADTSRPKPFAAEITLGLSEHCVDIQTEEPLEDSKVVKHPQLKDLQLGQCNVLTDPDPAALEMDRFEVLVDQLEAFATECSENRFQLVSKVVQSDETIVTQEGSHSCMLKSDGMQNCKSESLGHKDIGQNMNEMKGKHYPEVEVPETLHGLTSDIIEFEDSGHLCDRISQEPIPLGGEEHCRDKMSSFIFDEHVAVLAKQGRGKRSEMNHVKKTFPSIVGEPTLVHASRQCSQGKELNDQPRILAEVCAAELSKSADTEMLEEVTALISQTTKWDTIEQNGRLQNDASCYIIGLSEKATLFDQYGIVETDETVTLSGQYSVKTDNSKHDDEAIKDTHDTASGKVGFPLDTESSIDDHKSVTVEVVALKKENCTDMQNQNTVIGLFEELLKPKINNAVSRCNQEAGCQGRRTSWEQRTTRKQHSRDRLTIVNDCTAERQEEVCGGVEQLEEINLGYETSATITSIQKGNGESNNQRKRMQRQSNIPTSMLLRQGRSVHESSEPTISGQEDKSVDSGLIHGIKGSCKGGNLGCDLFTRNSIFPVRPRRNKSTRKEPALYNESRALEAMAGWNGKGGRSKKRITWLMLTEAEEGIRYIPQVGDEVAYVMQGHQEFLNSTELDDRGPWKTMRICLRAVEICRVVWLEYCCLLGYANTCCRLTLKFIDDDSKACGRSFKLLLPELTNFPDFIIEKVRYDAAMKRRWTKRDKCKVWWREGDGKGGKWWEGRVVAVEAKSMEFPESPWDRYTVKYRGDSSGLHKHSPWELFDLNRTKIESQHMDDHCKAQLLSTIEKVEGCKNSEDEYGLRKLRQLVNRFEFLSKVPVPLSLDIIKARLLNDYYRCLEALKYDVRLLVSNAENYSGPESDLTAKMRRLVDQLLEYK